MESHTPTTKITKRPGFTRLLIPGILIIMLAGIVFPFITADFVSSPQMTLPEVEPKEEATFDPGNSLLPQDYADAETTSSREPLNSSKKSTAAGLGLVPFMVPLYSKLSPNAVMANQSRAELYSLICSQPGITFGTLARVLNIAPGTAEYHLRILEREGYIRARKCGKFVRYYAWDTKTSPYTPVQQKILNSLAIEPDISQTDLAEKVGVSKQVVNYNLKQLRGFGILEEQKQGTKILCRIVSDSPYEAPQSC